MRKSQFLILLTVALTLVTTLERFMGFSSVAVASPAVGAVGNGYNWSITAPTETTTSTVDENNIKFVDIFNRVCMSTYFINPDLMEAALRAYAGANSMAFHVDDITTVKEIIWHGTISDHEGTYFFWFTKQKSTNRDAYACLGISQSASKSDIVDIMSNNYKAIAAHDIVNSTSNKNIDFFQNTLHLRYRNIL